MSDAKDHIDSVLKEDRVFPPPERIRGRRLRPQPRALRRALPALDRRSRGFWGERAAQLHWMQPWDQVLEWKPPFAKWFVGGKLNVSDNCLDRHLNGPRRNKAAIIWEGEPGDDAAIAHLPAAPSRGLPVRQRAQDARRQEGRPRRHLHADDPRGGDRDARLRADRRHAHRRLRRLHRRGAPRPHQRRAARRSSSPPTAAGGAAASCR